MIIVGWRAEAEQRADGSVPVMPMLAIGAMMKTWPNEFEAHGTHVGIVPLRPTHGPDLEAVIAKSNLHKLLYVAIPEPKKLCKRSNGAISSALRVACNPLQLSTNALIGRLA